MAANNELHFKHWFAQARQHTQVLKGEVGSMSPEEALVAVQGQYARLAHIRKVCRGDAFFVGVPRRTP